VNVQVAVQPIHPGSASLSASISMTEPDPDPSNNSGQESTVVEAASKVKYVAVTDSGFSPSSSRAGRGATVQWNFFGPGVHSATDGSGMALFDSGPTAPIAYSSFAFNAAGAYPVIDQDSYNTATILVPISGVPDSGGTGTTFAVTWAAAPIESGFFEDVQIQRPGAADFVDWKVGQTGTSASFIPDGGLGIYRFRARMRNTSNGAVSFYSDSVSIFVVELVFDFGFSPLTATVGQGSQVTWAIVTTDTQSHTVTDNTGLALFDSGPLNPGASYSYRFVGCGAYSVIDAITAHKSTMLIPILATPPNGGTETTFTITWAARRPSIGLVFDIQIKRPGGQWTDWKTGQTLKFATFVPDAGTGVYSFRGLLRRTSNGATSGYSPVASISVT
jgi:plastocyanin